MAKGLLRGTITFVISVVLGVALLAASYALVPTSKIQERLAIDWPALEQNWGFQTYPYVPNGATDSATDYHMLAIAAFDEYQDPLRAAMEAPFNVDKEDIQQINHLKASLHLAEVDHTATYTRYWHGYLVPLKLELFFMGYYSVLFYNGAALLALVVAVALLLHKRGLGLLTVPLLLAMVLSGPLNVSLTMELYGCAYLTLITLALVLVLGERIDPVAGTFFLGVGIVVNYVDFLTYPIVTLGIPLMVYALMPHSSRYRFTIRRTLMVCACWAIGYAGMWVAKWAVGSLILGQNLFEDALSQATVRMSSSADHIITEASKHISYLDVLGAEWGRMLGTYPAMACAALVVIGLAVLTFLRRETVRQNAARIRPAILPLAICTIMPFVWAFALKNHSYMHSYFTFRMFAPTVAAPLCLWASLLLPKVQGVPSDEATALEPAPKERTEQSAPLERTPGAHFAKTRNGR